MAAIVAGVIGLVATILEPLFQTQFPPNGSIAPSLADAIDGMPDAWWFRPRGFVIALIAAIISYALVTKGRRIQFPVNIGIAGAMFAFLGLSLTTHAAARQRWDWLSTTSVVVHEWSVGLWVGGLTALAIFWTGSFRTENDPVGYEPIRVFSRAALPLAAVGVATGIVNTGLILPSLNSVWQNNWGRILIAKVVVLLLVMLLAARHRRWLHGHREFVGVAFRRSVRLETVLAALVVVGGVLLALSAPPIESKGDLTAVNLAAPLPGTSGSPDVVHLVIDPAVAGENQLTVFLSPFDQHNVVSPTAVDRVRVTVTSLIDSNATQQITLEPDGNGKFVAQGTQFSLDGWWQADVLVRQPGVEDVVVPFYVLLPDPNVNGFDAPSIPPSSPEAQQMADAAFAQIDGIKSLSYKWRLTSGQGTAAVAERRLSIGFDGNPPTSFTTYDDFEILTIGNQTWQRTVGQPWIERTVEDIFPPSEWLEAYVGATGFTLGRQMQLKNTLTRVVTFVVPESEIQVAAWYAFWIDETTGHVVQEVMISRQHYMIYSYGEFDEPVVLPVPDIGNATPVPR